MIRSKHRIILSRGHALYVARARQHKAELAMDFTVPALPEEVPTVGEVLDRYLAHLRRRGSPSVKDITAGVECWVRPAFGEYRVDELNTPLILAWRDAMERAGLAENSRKTRYALLRAAVALSQREGLVDRNYADVPRGSFPKKTRPGFDPALEILTLEELGRVLLSVAIPPDRLLFYTVLGTTGMRLGEALDLAADDIDRTWQPLWQLTISSGWSRKNKRSQRPKTKRVRRVPCHPLLAQRLAQARGLLFADGGRRWDDKRCLRLWHEDLAAHGLRPRRLHALRHTFISLLLDAGIDQALVSCLTHEPEAGRAINTYSHFSWQARCRAVSALELGSEGT